VRAQAANHEPESRVGGSVAMLVQILNGLAYGGLLYVVAVGLVLIFGLRRVVNFAHGSLFMIGAYVGFSVAAIGGFWAAVLVAAAALALLGVLLDVVVLRPLQREDPIVTVLVTFGILLVLEDFAQTVWGKDFLSLPTPALLAGSVKIFGDSFPAYRLAVIALAAAVALALSFWLRHSHIGLYVRASSVDPMTTAMQGVDTDRVSAIVVALGTALAGLSGIVAAPLLALSPSMGNYILIESFIVVVVGGLGSFAGAFVAALAIGQVHNLGLVYVPWAATMIPFLLMVAVLIWRPTGLAGSRT
jgi:branched-chain amino acid transport system permease protein